MFQNDNSSNTKWTILFTCWLFFCTTLLLSSCETRPVGTIVGQPAPEFILKDRNDKTWTLSELKGQVVFINFWATWCPPCREEMPSMQKLFDIMPKDTFKMVAILNRDSPANADSFIKKLGITFPILNDQGNNIGMIYGLTGLPETFIVDKQGILREKFIGPAQWDLPEYVQMMNKYINESNISSVMSGENDSSVK